MVFWLIIKSEVEKKIRKFGTNDPFYIAERLGVLIEYADLGETLGFYFRNRRIKIININHNLSEIVQRFVCAHELGHVILHKDANTPALRRNTFFSTNKIEKEANQFAVELLMPDEAIYQYKNTNMTINEIAGIYGIPEEVTHLKKF